MKSVYVTTPNKEMLEALTSYAEINNVWGADVRLFISIVGEETGLFTDMSNVGWGEVLAFLHRWNSCPPLINS
ncbi:hypothetical protein [Enterobacter hormaechei]